MRADPTTKVGMYPLPMMTPGQWALGDPKGSIVNVNKLLFDDVLRRTSTTACYHLVSRLSVFIIYTINLPDRDAVVLGAAYDGGLT